MRKHTHSKFVSIWGIYNGRVIDVSVTLPWYLNQIIFDLSTINDPLAHKSNMAARTRPNIDLSLVKAADEGVLIFTCDQTTLPGHH